MKNELQKYDIDKPAQITSMAKILKKHIFDNQLSVQIVGKSYVMVEGWQFAGGMMGLLPRIVKVENIGPGKWMAQAEIINQKTKEVIGSGFAICSKEEGKKASFDEYAILSMAQTRAIGKAYRNLIGWIIKVAGYETTPAEEASGKYIKVGAETSPQATKNGTKIDGMMASEQDIARIKDLAKEMGLHTIKEMEKATGLVINFVGMTKKQAAKVYAELLRIKIGN